VRSAFALFSLCGLMLVLGLCATAAAQDPVTCDSAQRFRDARDLDAAVRYYEVLAAGKADCAGELEEVKALQATAALLAELAARSTNDPDGARKLYEQVTAIDAGRQAEVRAALSRLEEAERRDAPRCAAAADELTAGQVASAKAEYLKLSDRGLPCAKAGLEAVKRREATVKQLIALGEGLDAADAAAATTILTLATTLDTQSAAAARALAARGADDDFDDAGELGDDWLDDIADLGRLVGGLLAWLAVIAIALLALAWLARGLSRRFPPSHDALIVSALLGILASAAVVAFTEVDISAVALGLLLVVAMALAGTEHVRKVYPLQIRVENFTAGPESKADGAGLAALVSNEIREEREHAAAGADRTKPIGDDRFKEFTTALSASTPGKIAGTVLAGVRTLWPSQIVYVNGHLQQEGDRSHGLTLSIAEANGTLIGTTTVTPREGIAASATWLRLAIAGAAWIRFTLSKAYSLELEQASASWKSEAFFATAMALRDEPAWVRAELFAEALVHDPRNREAQFNLGVLEFHNGDPARAKPRFAGLVTRDDVEPGLKFQARYQQGACALAERKPIRAIEIARNLVAELNRELSVPDRETKAPTELLRALEGPALVLLASAMRANRVRSRSLARTAFATALEDQPSEPAWRAELGRALSRTWTTDADILAFLEQPDVVINARTRYTLACYYSRVAAGVPSRRREAEKASLTQLKRALATTDSELAAWAANDSGLSWVREHRPQAFSLAIASAEASEIAQMTTVGADTAATLEETLDIATAAALAYKLRSGGEPYKSALGVSDDLLRRWAAFAELRELPLMSPGYANMLADVGISDKAQLGRARAGIVVRLLRDEAKQHDPPLDAPPRALVEMWIREAQQ
jgi:hypothetical protein